MTKQAGNQNEEEGKDLFLPKDTQEFLKAFGKVENCALAQNHFFYGQEQSDGSVKIEPLLYYKKKNNGTTLKFGINKDLLEQLNARNGQIIGSIGEYGFLKCTYKPDIGLMIGGGADSPYNNVSVMTLHPLYGIPYIPASAIKGCVRGYYIRTEFAGNEDKAKEDPVFQKIFGLDKGRGIENGQAGGIIFLDAYPKSSPEIYYDIFAPHYDDYYKNQGSLPPKDDGKVNLLFFPAVRATSFQILCCAKSKEDAVHLEKLKAMLKAAIQVMGLGGKTAVGYGIGQVNLQ